jgi:hypothetical protein
MGDGSAPGDKSMKQLLMMLVFALAALGQGTDLSGPIGALPNAFGPTGICSWNTGQLFKTCFVTTSGISANYTVTAQPADYVQAGINIAQTFTASQTINVSSGNALTVNANIICSTTCALGDSLHSYTELDTHIVRNYNAGTFLTIDSETSFAGIGISIATGTAADIVLAPNATEAFRVTAAGNITFPGNAMQIGTAANQANLIVSNNFFSYLSSPSTANFCALGLGGIACVDGGATQFSVVPSTGQILSNALAGTGYRRICTDPSGNIVVSYSCPVNSTLFTSCTNSITLTSTYQTTGCTIISTVTGYWLLTSTVQLVAVATGSASFGAFINGSLPVSTDISNLINAGAGTIASSLTHSWIYNLNLGDVIDIRAASFIGASNQSGVGNLTMVYLHP